MADRYWVPGGADQLSSTGNWSTVRYGATGSSVPGDDDNAYLLDGAGELSATGIDTLSLAAINNITFGPKFAMTAPAGQVISIQCNGAVMVESSSPNLPLAMVTTVAKSKSATRAGTVILSGAGTTTVAYLLGGNINLMSTFTPTTMYAGGDNLNIWSEYSATKFTACEFYKGRFLSNRGFTTLSQFGDIRTTRMAIRSDTLAVDMGTWNLHGGLGHFASNGTIAALNARHGLWTPQGAPGNPTITDSTFYGSNENVNVVSKVGNVEVTFTFATSKVGDATVVTDNGQFAGLVGI